MSLPNNTLPNADPAIQSGPTPYFIDNTFVRGDHMRANNQRIWANEAALLANDQYLDAKVGTFATYFRQYTARSGFTINAGDLVSYYPSAGTIQTNGKRFVQYSPTQVASLSRDGYRFNIVLNLTATTFVALYVHDTAHTGIAGKIGTLNAAIGAGTRSCSFASQVEIAATGATNGLPFAACVLSPTVFVVAYMNAAGTGIVTQVCTVSAGTFTAGAAQTQTFTATLVHISSLDATHFILMANLSSAANKYYVGSVSGSSVTYGTGVSAFGGVTTASANAITSGIISISASSAIVVGQGIDGTAAHVGLELLTISGTTITSVAYNANLLTLSSAAGQNPGAVQYALSEDGQALIMYVGYAVAYSTTAGTQIVVFSTSMSPTSLYQSVIGVENIPDQFSAYSDNIITFGQYLMLCLFDDLIVLGTNYNPAATLINHTIHPYKMALATPVTTPAIRIGGYAKVKINPSRSRCISLADSNTGTTLNQKGICRLDNSTLIAIVGTDNGANILIEAYPIEVHSAVGIALDGSASPPVGGIRVQRRGDCTLFTGLTPGQKYFIGDDGTPSISARNWSLGHALSATEIDMSIEEIVI